MRQYGQYCLDLFDTVQQAAVNMPQDYAICHVPHPGVFTFGGKLVSWEESTGVVNLRPGMEKFSAPEGSRLVLARPGKEHFYFQLPARPVAQNVVFALPHP